MSVVVSNQEVGPCERQVKVEVPAPAVEAETGRVLQEYRRRASIPGFRKGKVPESVVRNRFAKEIEEEVIDRLIPRYWRQAQAESELSPLLPPRVSEVELSPGAEMTFTALVEVRPELGSINLEELDLPDASVEPSAEEVDRALEELRRESAPWVAVERAAARGDRVEVELRELVEGGDEAEARKVQFEVGDEQVWEELSLEITGLEAGQRTEFRRAPRGDEEQRRYEARLLRIEERDPPPLDDELAKRLGDFAGLDELREALARRLRAAKRGDRKLKRETALLDQLRERHPTPLPKRVVEQEIEQLLRDYAEGLSRQGVDLERTQIDWQGLAEKVSPQAEKRVHARLLLDAAAHQLDIQLEESELERALANIARAEGQSTVAVRRALDSAGRLEQLREQLRREKALRRLVEPEEGGSGEDQGEGRFADQSSEAAGSMEGSETSE